VIWRSLQRPGPFPMRSNTSNDDLVLWDLSNPAAPRVVQKFSGVVKWLPDWRRFIYVLNATDYAWFRSQPIASRNERSPRTTNGVLEQLRRVRLASRGQAAKRRGVPPLAISAQISVGVR
jgi:hypothetical protein